MGKDGTKHLLAVATACAIWGGSLICSKLSYESLAPMQLGLVRFGLSALLFFALAGALRQLRPPQGRDFALVAASGFLGTTLYFASENLGASMASGATSSLVVGSFPAMTLVLECLIDRTSPHPRMAAGIALAFVGVCVLAFTEQASAGTDELAGIGILMAGGLCWGIYNIMMRGLAGRYHALTITCWQTFYGTLGFVPLALLEGAPVQAVSPTTATCIVYLVVCCTVAGFSLYNYGFEELPPTVVASLVNLTPVVGLALSALLLHETISAQQLLGGAVVLAGIALSSLPESA